MQYEAFVKDAGYNDVITLFSEDGHTRNGTDYGSGTRIHSEVIFDYFCTDMKSLAEKLEDLLRNRFSIWRVTQPITVYVFAQDKDACHNNDRVRNRKQLASASIEKGIEEFDVDKFKEICAAMPNTNYGGKSLIAECAKLGVFVQRLPVVRAMDVKDPGFLYSAWKYGEDADDGFSELDDYLEKYCPQITFLEYKKLQKFVEIDDSIDYDYYDEDGTRSVQWKVSYARIYDAINKVNAE
jgi:hypothetical protein